jgi:O-antigen ligase
MNFNISQEKKEVINRFLEYLVLFFCGLFILISPYSTSIGKITLWYSVFFWFLIHVIKFKQRSYQALFPPNYLNKFFAVFLVSILISILFSSDIYHSQRILVNHYIGYWLIFCLGLFIVNSTGNLFLIEITFILMGIIIGLGGCLDYLYSHVRLLTSFGIRINLTNYLVVYIPINYAIILFSRNKLLKLFSVIGLILLLVCLFMNTSNTAIGAIVGTVLFITFFKSRRLTIFLILFFLILAAIVSFYFGKSIYADLRNDVLNRAGLWKTSLKIFKDFPVFGSGLGMFEKLLYSSKYLPLGGYRDGNQHLHAHSTYLEILAETGIVGLSAFCAIFIGFMKQIIKVFKTISEDKSALFFGAVGAVFSNLLLGFSSSIITVGFVDVLMFWLLFGMAVRLSSDM